MSLVCISGGAGKKPRGSVSSTRPPIDFLLLAAQAKKAARAAKFGIGVDKSKLEERVKRFGTVTVDVADFDAKKKARVERFK